MQISPKTPVASEDYPMIVTIDDTVEVRERQWTEYLAELWLGKGDRQGKAVCPRPP